ncbi:MAG: hypothetical protein OEZ58_03740 [Gammaproteobacteria bacterium]|nr:hypothetical protein [Gammaproteobacteria bacterium]MDH5728076.1 hypothetical protein [Gammaproteobacteria bacterium]
MRTKTSLFIAVLSLCLVYANAHSESKEPDQSGIAGTGRNGPIPEAFIETPDLPEIIDNIPDPELPADITPEITLPLDMIDQTESQIGGPAN